MVLQTGKLPHALLRKMIKYRGTEDRRVVLGPKIGEDAAVIDMGDEFLILKTDPITYAIDEIGWYAVHINANDIATMGGKPRWMQTSMLLPQGISERKIEKIFRDIDKGCKELGIAITGGHTEINPWLERPIIVGDMHGTCRKRDLIFTSGAKVGDSIVLTKGAGIEGTATLAREQKAHLRRKFSKSFIKRAENYLYEPGISVVREAMMGVKYGATSMHDPTEGGVSVGLYEVAIASDKGMLIDGEEIIIGKETEALCEFFRIDPLGLLGSGALLLTISSRRAERYVDALSEEGVKAAIIGEVKKKAHGLKISKKGKKAALRYSQKDEILKVL